MPSFIVKLADNEYIEWSTIVDAPTSYVVNYTSYVGSPSSSTEGKRP